MGAESERTHDREIVVKPTPLRIEASLVSPTIKMRVYYSKYHAWSAKHFAQLAGRIEDAHEGESKFDIQHRAYVTAAIFATVSFLESTINELFKDAWDNIEGRMKQSEYLESLDPIQVRRLADVWKFTEANNKRPFTLLDKYDIALDIAGKPCFEKGHQPFQDASLLIQLRNELVHFRPETLGGDDRHRLEKKLSKKFALNRLMTGSGNSFFPDHCLGYGCCKWAVSASEAFADEFFNRMGLAPIYRSGSWPDPAEV